MTFARKRDPSRSVEQAAGQAAPDAGENLAGFESTFQRYWTRICAVLTRLLGDPDEAEDLALDVFYRLYTRPPASEDNLGGWLYRTAAHLGLNALRARSRRKRYEEEAGMLDPGDGHDWDPASAIERTQEREQVRQALAQMKPRAAQALLLRHSGFSYREIAEALEVPPTTVGTLLARAEKEFLARFSTK